GYTSPTTSGSTACRGCLSGPPRTLPWTARRPRPPPCWPSPGGTPRRPRAWKYRTAWTSVRSPGSSRPPPVDHQANQGDPSPSLHPHYQASSLLRDGLPPCPATVLCPSRRDPLEELPLAPANQAGDSVGATGSHVPCKSPDQARAAYMPDAVWAVSR